MNLIDNNPVRCGGDKRRSGLSAVGIACGIAVVALAQPAFADILDDFDIAQTAVVVTVDGAQDGNVQDVTADPTIPGGERDICAQKVGQSVGTGGAVTAQVNGGEY